MLTNEQKEHIDNMSYNDKWQLVHDTDNSDILEYLSDHESVDARYRVAMNDNTPIDILVKLSDDEYWYVRWMVVQNDHISIGILNKLSRDGNKYVSSRANEQIEKRKYESRCINIDKCTIRGILE